MTRPTFTDVYLGLAKRVQDTFPGLPLALKGMPQPDLSHADDFIDFQVLSFLESPARTHTVDLDLTIQIMCYAKHAERRADNKIARVFELADMAVAAFQRKDVVIKDTCILFKEARIIPLDLRSIGDFSKVIYQQSPPLDFMCAVVLIDGCVGSHTLPPTE